MTGANGGPAEAARWDRPMPGDGAEVLAGGRVLHGVWEGRMRGDAKVIVGLSEAVESLRAELMRAVEAGKDQPMQFSVEPIELIAQVAVTKEADGKIGWNLLGMGGSWESASTQTLTLKLTPVWKKPDGTLERDFTIASASQAGDVIGPHS